MGKVGIFGGTFNPIHNGHLLAAETALNQASLDRIFWVPSSHAPYKSIQELAPLPDRYQIVQRAIDSHPKFVLTESEASRYAVDTLKGLQHRYGNCEWYWILGVDAFRSLPRWVGRHELIPQCHWLVVPRSQIYPDPQPDGKAFLRENGTSTEVNQSPAGLEDYCQQVAEQLWTEAIDIQWQLLQMPIIQISSSLVRRYCQQGRSIRYLVPDSVREYIAAHCLYGWEKN
ncbi:nicotinate (nicotinamide) nucleotide adenylyltransferase [Leptolyngbya ohadii]|uniref:nicotinate (nicotinamide) nucleotide adenylyltransferase n=1 Tax=Leptolyngbya ohadii TaxID=1962290 RepID=UPI000B599C84|nr:nicotinate (nicotinamide) nucleotide adenylyltransferase [Leptolyngbya ohadii]